MHNTTDMHTPDDSPLYVRIAPIARSLGLSKRMLISEAEAGRIPLQLERFGKARVVHVLAADAQAFIKSKKGNTP
jgi:hypothetical protein